MFLEPAHKNAAHRFLRSSGAAKETVAMHNATYTV
jgi:hypothetical protein